MIGFCQASSATNVPSRSVCAGIKCRAVWVREVSGWPEQAWPAKSHPDIRKLWGHNGPHLLNVAGGLIDTKMHPPCPGKSNTPNETPDLSWIDGQGSPCDALEFLEGKK